MRNDEGGLWTQAAWGDPGAEGALITQYFFLVRAAVRKWGTKLTWVDAEDLESLAALGLVKAVQSYDPSRGVPFAAWAELCIKREILDSDDVRRGLPKGAYRDWRTLQAAHDRLAEALARAPDDAELAAALGWSEAKVGEVLEMMALFGARRFGELEGEALEQQGGTAPATAGGVPGGLLEALAHLTPLEQQILWLHYWDDVPLREIAVRLERTQTDVHTNHYRARKKLREFWPEGGGYDAA